MEKTIQIMQQEAYVNGYNDARIAIAKQIEDSTIFFPHTGIAGETLIEPIEIMVDLRTRFTAIAKGRYESLVERLKVETKPCYFCQGEGILQSGEECSCFTDRHK